MATRLKSTRWGYATRLTDVATNTTLAGATRYEFGAKTIYVPETTRTFRSVIAHLTFFMPSTTAKDYDAVRVGSNVAGAGWTDADITYTAADSGENEVMHEIRDITANVVTNAGSGSSFTLDIAVAVATESADNIRGITCEVFVTYDYSDAASTQIKTVQIPLQSGIGQLTTSYSEVGSAGTGGAPANQIPQLTSSGLLPESSITIRDQYIVVRGTTAGSAATTDHTYTARLDGSTDLVRAVYEGTLQTSYEVVDILDSSLMPSTTAAHAFELKSDLTDRFSLMGGELVVTYEFDPTSSTILNSVVAQLRARGALGWNEKQGYATEQARRYAYIDIQEPTTITMKQSGIYLCGEPSGINWVANADGQTARTYSVPVNQQPFATLPLIHRTDHSSSTWSLSRGLNRLGVTFTSGNGRHMLGYAILNYTSGKASDGVGAHNQTHYWHQLTTNGTPDVNIPTSGVVPVEPVIPGANYTLNAVIADSYFRTTGGEAEIKFYKQNGEGGETSDGFGFYGTNALTFPLAAAELGHKRYLFNLLFTFRNNTYPTTATGDGADIETERTWYWYSNVNATVNSVLTITHHEITFAYSGRLTIDGVAQTSKTIYLFEHNTSENPAVLVGEATTDGSGDFSFTVLDSTKNYVAYYDDGSTYAGASRPAAPGTGRDIAINTAPFAGTKSRIVNTGM